MPLDKTATPGKPRVFVTHALVGGGLERLARDLEVEVWDGDDPPPKDVLFGEAMRSDALLTTIADNIDSPLLAAAPRLRIISQLATGYNNIDVEAATQRGVLVTTTPGVLANAVADLAFALILAHARRIVEGDRVVRGGAWGTWSPTFLLGNDVHGKTLGIVGLGEIGMATAKRAWGFEMSVLYWSRTRKPEVEWEGLAWRDLDDLLKESDIVSISAALTPDTRHLIGARELSLMKQDAVLVNTARGGLVDQEALCAALSSRRLRGAALDVFALEPLPVTDALVTMDNVLLSPHAGSATVETRTRMTDMAVDNLLTFFRGGHPRGCVNSGPLDHPPRP